jgi:hypothetical protein
VIVLTELLPRLSNKGGRVSSEPRSGNERLPRETIFHVPSRSEHAGHLERNGAIAMTTKTTPVEQVERNNAKEPLTEIELNNVNGGSQSSGAGAGKVRFNDFHITKKSDKASPILF